jgi:hypothetical protein
MWLGGENSWQESYRAGWPRALARTVGRARSGGGACGRAGSPGGAREVAGMRLGGENSWLKSDRAEMAGTPAHRGEINQKEGLGKQLQLSLTYAVH